MNKRSTHRKELIKVPASTKLGREKHLVKLQNYKITVILEYWKRKIT